MPRGSESVFHEEQALRQARMAIVLATVPLVFAGLVIWQVVLGHPWGRHPMSNASLIGWTIFLWLIYGRLMTVKLVTDVRPDSLSVAMRGLWRVHHIPLEQIESVEVVTFNAARDFGGYGVRTAGRTKAYVAAGDQGVSLKLRRNRTVVIGSRRSNELAKAISDLRAHA
jgi:hypothetical protein